MKESSASGPIRWSGLALALSGVPLVVVAVFHPNIFHTGFTAASATGSWVVLHLLAAAAMVLTLFGVVGLYARQAGRLGGLGLYGLLLAVPGIVVVACVVYLEAIAMPVLAAQAPALLALDGPLLGSVLLRATAALAAGYPVGLILLGIATWRAGILPAGAAITFTVGTASFSVFEGLFVPVLGIASTVLFAAGCGWLGHAIWSAAPDSSQVG